MTPIEIAAENARADVRAALATVLETRRLRALEIVAGRRTETSPETGDEALADCTLQLAIAVLDDAEDNEALEIIDAIMAIATTAPVPHVQA
ncbi:hypothetical protein [Methylobacterium sp. WL6]|uniref:hypothetical protein n=1 Tax=Methylobacterium sp. WL6 TaxID=2603901 RepID=UPI0011CBBB89|nr:hypothetical protein [Methylobacterium sp. WL6]TXN73263.1 hypothetical protein FV230_01975 [Methylobacterium sp. WL6]